MNAEDRAFIKRSLSNRAVIESFDSLTEAAAEDLVRALVAIDDCRSSPPYFEISLEDLERIARSVTLARLNLNAARDCMQPLLKRSQKPGQSPPNETIDFAHAAAQACVRRELGAKGKRR